MAPKPFVFLDKENSHRQEAINNKNQQQLTVKNSNPGLALENTFNLKTNVKQNKHITRSSIRQPLGGKDQNKIIPNLQRSQSTLNSIQDNKLRRTIALLKKPKLVKANSSLGFSHGSNSLKENSIIEPKFLNTSHEEQLKPSDIVSIPNIKNNVFKNSPDIYNEGSHFTDSLIKSDAQKSDILFHSELPNLKSTISTQTNQLNVSNVQKPDYTHFDVDPIKRNPKRIESTSFSSNKVSKSSNGAIRQFKIHQDLMDSDDEIEYVPKKIPTLPYAPSDVEPLNENDFNFFHGKNIVNTSKRGQYGYPGELQDQIDSNLKEITNVDNMVFEYENDDKMNDENEDIQNVGLSVNDLKDLIDLS